jgi:UDP-N-acetylglucosamine 2-epimerase
MQEAVFRREVDARGYREILVHTGQHYDQKMSQVFFDELDIPRPDVNIGVGSGSHGQQTGRMLESLDDVIEEYRPDAIVVDGDTNSTLAGALAAAKLQVPLVHVEAGLRSFDRRMPEEVNRVVADHLANLLCAPTGTAVANLRNEGLVGNVVLTGDLMYDCFLHFRERADHSVIAKCGLSENGFVLATVHRAENTDEPTRFREIISGLSRLPLPVIMPAHPRIRGQLSRTGRTFPRQDNLIIVDPAGYLEMLALEQHARCILTDSGGVQREAFFAGKPSIVLRDTTEWKEQVECGWSLLSGANASAIATAFEEISNQPMIERPDIYGDGSAAAKVVTAIEELLG